MKLTVRMKNTNKSHKNLVSFEEIGEDGLVRDPRIGSISPMYVRKSTLTEPYPSTITVTIEA